MKTLIVITIVLSAGICFAGNYYTPGYNVGVPVMRGNNNIYIVIPSQGLMSGYGRNVMRQQMLMSDVERREIRAEIKWNNFVRSVWAAGSGGTPFKSSRNYKKRGGQWSDPSAQKSYYDAVCESNPGLCRD